MRLYILLITVSLIPAHALQLTGRITGAGASPPDNALVMFTNAVSGSVYSAYTDAAGDYSIALPGASISDRAALPVFNGNPGAFPNPFSGSTVLSCDIRQGGVVRAAVYSMQGIKIRELEDRIHAMGPVSIRWDGRDDRGRGLRPGVYLVSLQAGGHRSAIRVVLAPGAPSASGSFFNEHILKLQAQNKAAALDTPYIMEVEADGFQKHFADSVSVAPDTVLDISLAELDTLPFKTEGDYLAVSGGTGYDPFFIKGINLGVAMPGRFPSEVQTSVSRADYRRWIARMKEVGFNALRIYTLHPPRFYEELYRYNKANPADPLYLFQGIWLKYNDADFFGTDTVYGGRTITAQADAAIDEMIGCLHGRHTVPERSFEAWGTYRADVSPWVAGIIYGREIDPGEVAHTDLLHPDSTSYTGRRLSLPSGTATEVWLTGRLDNIIGAEYERFGVQRPVSVSSWPTLDPLEHPTETGYEDSVHIDLGNIDVSGAPGGYFASFHAYPYFPDFMNTDTLYRLEADSAGTNSYIGYLKDLKGHYRDIPLVIAEYGVPSSMGNAHFSYYSGMHHGGLTEDEQGEYALRMMYNQYETGCAGGMLFAWMDEWFKNTWVVHAIETGTDDVESSHRYKWHNITSPEQNFGLVTFDPAGPPVYTDLCDTAGVVLRAAADFRYCRVQVALDAAAGAGDTVWLGFDTYRADLGESVLPNGKTVGNRVEFALMIPAGGDTARLYVIPSYDLYGYTIRFNFADTTVQKFRSMATDTGIWNPVRWMNSGTDMATQEIGRLPMARGIDPALAPLQAVDFGDTLITVILPWSLLHFSDPVIMEVVDGFAMNGHLLQVTNSISDGIGIAVCVNGAVTETDRRFSWPSWLAGPVAYIEREKRAMAVIEAALPSVPGRLPGI